MIKEVKKNETIEETTCKKCGSTSFKSVVLSNHKRGGPGLSQSKALVCRNCGYAEEIN